MNALKTIYVSDDVASIIIIQFENYNIPYISVEKLKEWIEQNKYDQGTGQKCITVHDLLTFLNETK